MKTHNKLVRDLIPDIIEKNGETAVTRQLSGAEYKEELLKKIVEEAEEVRDAGSNTDELTKEIGDVLEVVEHILKAFKINPNDVAEIKKVRKEKRGGFVGRIYLESTNEISKEN